MFAARDQIGYDNKSFTQHVKKNWIKLVDILFRTRKLEKECCDSKKRDQAYGPLRSKLLGRRLDQMRAAANLGEFKHVHSRCHPLKGNRKGEWSADLDGPYRLLFEPVIPEEAGEGGDAHEEVCDITAITVVRILEAGVDTHE